MAHGMHSICQLFATRVLFPSSGACKEVVAPHYLRAIGGDAADTPPNVSTRSVFIGFTTYDKELLHYFSNNGSPIFPSCHLISIASENQQYYLRSHPQAKKLDQVVCIHVDFSNHI